MIPQITRILKSRLPRLSTGTCTTIAYDIMDMVNSGTVEAIVVNDELDRIRDAACKIMDISTEAFHRIGRRQNQVHSRMFFVAYYYEFFHAKRKKNGEIEGALQYLADYIGRGLWCNHATICNMRKKGEFLCKHDPYLKVKYLLMCEMLNKNS